MTEICGIDAETLRAVAREFAGAKSAMIFWGMGVSQHIHGTDNSRCLISLALNVWTGWAAWYWAASSARAK